MNETDRLWELIEDLRKRGFNQNQIAEMTGKSRQYISKVKRSRDGYYRSPREIAMEHYPWDTGEKFHEAQPNRMMRHHFEYMVTDGEGMQEWKLEHLRRFYLRLKAEDLVVEFDPAIPPGDLDLFGGFAYRKRRPIDGKLIIRVNQHTRLTDEGKRLLVFPKVLPATK